MSQRRHPLLPGQVYHIFNRSVGGQPIFLNTRDYQRFYETIDFYRFVDTDMRFSFYNRLDIEERLVYIKKLHEEGEKQVAIFSYCLMPNHFHFLAKELVSNGVRKFLSNLQNSYAKYFNTKNKRGGALFREMFKAVRIESDEQFMHVARYIHLNPFSSFMVKNFEELTNYPWSSLPGYLGYQQNSFIDYDFLLSYYSNKEKLKTFTFDQGDYQRRLKEIEHLLIE